MSKQELPKPIHSTQVEVHFGTYRCKYYFDGYLSKCEKVLMEQVFRKVFHGFMRSVFKVHSFKYQCYDLLHDMMRDSTVNPLYVNELRRLLDEIQDT